MKKACLILLGVMLSACSNTGATQPDDTPVLQETTLTRYDGTAISVEELASLHPSAIANAETIARIDRMLNEPWAEHRDAVVFIENLRAKYPSDTRLSQTLWETTEPAERGNGRDVFHEYGFYANQFLANGFGPRVRPGSLEDYVSAVLETHTDQDSRGMLLAAWRRFAPLVVQREPGYLAAQWQLELDYVQPVRIGLCDSLLGPFDRAFVLGDSQPSFFGPTESYEGYTTSVMLLDLLTPGPVSPVRGAIKELQQLVDGARSSLTFVVGDGPDGQIDDVDVEFLSAALAGLQQGIAGVESLPQGVKTLGVVFSYLVDGAEARSSLTFTRIAGDWQLSLFEYEPAAASLFGNNARLDLMPTIRALLSPNRRG